MTETYRIVTGVDGSASSRAALRWALWHADLAGGAITALMAWDLSPIYGWAPDDAGHRTARTLQDVVHEVAGESRVPVERVVVQGGPAKALIDAAADADLLVVGSRGHGGFTGALLGSVGQHCVQHAACPVVVVREPGGRTG
ncbi:MULTISPECIES: universal stress protein [Saccharopolyspora]|uniref:Universal stress protein n=1 Tax=Saccharopolyspora gregorii TaxID=33914 RepID=A0ABP6RU40_9PSEU|nr:MULTISPECIES: universal stress protein [unclassified Saccharopolyspora]MCA1187023.1 universal stress protein [Saccharopolyspora sp. 6T]MCA1191890.1 universal stress protein [Saccharopolyspora sp. 6V]MCA1224812.1 universal stress protein [Saccharopolyspora sp. 6M]MCA1280160.1 universal stress protein [Saccharopolyspora sp. 7B]